MSEQLIDLAWTTVGAGGYTAGSGVLNVASTSTGSGPKPFAGSGVFSVSISDPTTHIVKSELTVNGINSGTQFATASEGLDVNCNAGDIVSAVQTRRSLSALLCGPVAALFVPTIETTTSTSFVDLTTPDSVTFTLIAARNVVIQYIAYEINSLANTACINIVNVDGSDVTGTDTFADANGATQDITGFAGYVVSLVAGAHTIKIRHRVAGGTGTWLRRLLVVSTAP